MVDVGLHKLAGAVGTVAAAAGVVLAEIIQQIAAQAAGGFAVPHHHRPAARGPAWRRLRPVQGLAFIVIVGVLDKILCRLHIPQGEQQDALGALAIAPGAARFLIVVFQIFLAYYNAAQS